MESQATYCIFTLQGRTLVKNLQTPAEQLHRINLEPLVRSFSSETLEQKSASSASTLIGYPAFIIFLFYRTHKASHNFTYDVDLDCHVFYLLKPLAGNQTESQPEIAIKN